MQLESWRTEFKCGVQNSWSRFFGNCFRTMCASDAVENLPEQRPRRLLVAASQPEMAGPVTTVDIVLRIASFPLVISILIVIIAVISTAVAIIMSSIIVMNDPPTSRKKDGILQNLAGHYFEGPRQYSGIGSVLRDSLYRRLLRQRPPLPPSLGEFWEPL